MKDGLGWITSKNGLSSTEEILVSLGGAVCPKIDEAEVHCQY